MELDNSKQGLSYAAIGEPSQVGMSLRDYFAGQALQGLIANYKIVKQQNKKNLDTTDIDWFPESAYKYADAMLKVRGE